VAVPIMELAYGKDLTTPRRCRMIGKESPVRASIFPVHGFANYCAKKSFRESLDKFCIRVLID
jgi:hypothetical protein